MFHAALGDAYERLHPALQDLHRVAGSRVFRGHSQVRRGSGVLASLVCALFSFPKPSEHVDVTVRMERHGEAERWTRVFGGSVFHSVLRAGRPRGSGVVWERFGPFAFAIGLVVSADGTRLEYPVQRGVLLGCIPIPKPLLPVSQTAESVDERGRPRFDMSVSIPLVGFVVGYRGTLAPALPLQGS